MRDLVERAQDGDREAFAALVGMTSDRMFALAARILRDGDLAEDALQSALIAVWRHLPTLRDPDRFEAWVRRLLVHQCYAEARRRRSWSANVRVLPVDGPAGPDGLLSVVDRDALDRAFRRLSIEQRAVFVLHHHVGLPLTEIAETLGDPGRHGPLATPLRDSDPARGCRGRRGAGRPRGTDGMTTERDFDRLARAWLELGPDEAPDRVVAAVLQAAETTPQARRRTGWPVWRSFHMTRLPIVATVVATLAVVIGGGFLLTRGNDPGLGAPTATPNASPSTTAPGYVPEELLSEWISGTRAFPGLHPDAGSDLRFTVGGFTFAQSNSINNVLARGFASSPDTGRLQLTTQEPSLVCQADETGLYSWTLSPGGTTLTITAESDACAPRLTAIAGEWTRVRCVDPNDSCLGDVEAGTYRSQFFTPRLPPLAAWTANYGGLTYTVPDGWANSADWPMSYDLVPAASYPPVGDAAVDTHGIYLVGQPAAQAQSRDDTRCVVAEAEGVGHTVDDLVGWISSHPGLDAGEPAPVTIGGRAGQMIDVKVAPEWTATCADYPGQAPLALMFTQIGTPPDTYSWGIGQGQTDRIILLDLGEGQVVLIGITTNRPGAFDALVAEAMPIIESFEFE